MPGWLGLGLGGLALGLGSGSWFMLGLRLGTQKSFPDPLGIYFESQFFLLRVNLNKTFFFLNRYPRR